MDDQKLIDRNHRMNIIRLKRWIKKVYSDEWRYPEAFDEGMVYLILSAAQLRKDNLPRLKNVQ